MNEDEKAMLFEEADAFEKALEFPLKPVGSRFAGKDEPPWGVNRSAARRTGINDRAKLYFRQLKEAAEEHNVPPSEVVERKHRMQDWIEECARWDEDESFDERQFRLKKRFDELFLRDKITTPAGRSLPPGQCCSDGLIRLDKTMMRRRDGELARTDGFIKTCVVCDKGQSRAAYLKGDKE